MTSLIKCLAIALLLSGVRGTALGQVSPEAGNGSSPSGPGYTITLTQPTDSFRLDSPIQVTMTITNITTGDVFWRAILGTDKDAWYPGFRFLLKKAGKEPETTFFHRKTSGRQRPNDPAEVWSGNTILLPKPPGTMFVMTIDVKHLYEIKEPGQYTLEVTRLAEDDKTVVHSNAVTLKVVP